MESRGAMAIWLDVDPRSGVPLYVQIVQQVRHAIDVGALQPGEQLPTVRQLASELTIAPNTIVKAYNELQAMNLIDSTPGVGTVVIAHSNGDMRARQVAVLRERLRALVRDAATIGLDADELLAHLKEEIEEFKA
jgi:GntR family transcriptional regulator